MPSETANKGRKVKQDNQTQIKTPGRTCLLPVGLNLELIVRNGASGECKQDYLFFEFGTENQSQLK